MTGSRGTVLLVGPYPPPEHGTSIPFREMATFIARHYRCTVLVANSHPRGARSAADVARLTWLVLSNGWRSDVCVLYGSNRFVSTLGAAYAWCLRRRQAPAVHFYVAGGSFDWYCARLGRLRRAALRRAMRFARSLTVQTSRLEHAMGAWHPNVLVAPNWVTLDAGLVRPARLAETGRCNFAFVGEVRPEKGVRQLLAAYTGAKAAAGGKLGLEFFGPVSEDCAHEVDAAKAADPTIKVHGQVPHEQLLRRLADSCDVLVLPTLHEGEGYPGAILEALVMGIPVVATDHPNLLELLRHERESLICRRGDVSDLTKALVRLAGDAALRSRLARNAMEAGRQFGSDVVLERLCNSWVLESTLGRRTDEAPASSLRILN